METAVGAAVGILVVIVSLLILFFNVEVPNELKGFIFYAQVSIQLNVQHYSIWN